MKIPPDAWSFRSLAFPCLMGIVNVTLDSFSDAGQFFDLAAAVNHARQLAKDGAAILDLGAEASSFFRAGIEAIPPAEQLRRLLPVLEQLRDLSSQVAVSIDTRSAQVAEIVLREQKFGVRIINDISAGTHDPHLLRAVAGKYRETMTDGAPDGNPGLSRTIQTGESKIADAAAIILMHISLNYPATPVMDDPDIVATVKKYLAERFAAAVAAGIAPERIALDPGIGFGKTMADNWRLAFRAGEIAAEIGHGKKTPIVLGASRKRFLETQPPADVRLPAEWPALLDKLREQDSTSAAHPRDAASAALTAFTARQGVEIHRVHNVGLARWALRELG